MKIDAVKEVSIEQHKVGRSHGYPSWWTVVAYMMCGRTICVQNSMCVYLCVCDMLGIDLDCPNVRWECDYRSMKFSRPNVTQVE